MPIIGQNFNQELFNSVQIKCAHMGVDVSAEDFQNNPSTYYNIAYKYDQHIKVYLSINRTRQQQIYQNLLAEEKLSIEEAFEKSKKILEEEAIEKIKNKDFWVNKSVVFQNSHNAHSLHNVSPLQRVEKIKSNIALWQPQHNECKHFEHLDTHVLTKSSYYNYFHAFAQQLGLNSYSLPHFKNLLKNYHGSIGEFLNEYQYLLIRKNEQRPLSVAESIHTLFQIEPLRTDTQLVAKIYGRKTALRYQHRFGLKDKFFFYWKKSKKQDSLIRNIQMDFAFSDKFNPPHYQPSLQHFIRSAIFGTSFIYFGYMGGKQLSDVAPVKHINHVTLSAHKFGISRDSVNKSILNFADVNNISDTLMKVHQDIAIPQVVSKPLADTYQIYETKAPVTIPKIAGDNLKRAPNIDFFNFCFAQSHPKNNGFGISSELFNSFIKENKPLANMYSVRSYNNLNFNQARIIAKAQIFDKYSIGYMQNSRIAAYLYHVLLRNTQSAGAVAQTAKAVKDFYTGHDKNLSYEQKQALERLLVSDTEISKNDWTQLVSLINDLKTNTNEEKELFALMQQYENSNHDVNFAYTPTLQGNHVDIDHITGTPQQMTNTYTQVLEAQKDKDLETFSKIYMQCCYDNFVKLENGSKSQTFRDADTALKQHGLGHLSKRYYCAGMSMASFCQATDIFTAENPNSHVGKALNKILDNCRNVHLCNTLKTDLNLLTKTVIYSTDLEKDIRHYMTTNKNAIVFGWAPRGNGRFHHQTFFNSSLASSQDAYTYCAYNRQHWGNETTFANYMNSRSAHGKGGYYADISIGINKLAEKFISQDIQQYYIAACENAEQQKQRPEKDFLMAMAKIRQSSMRVAS